MSHAKRQRGVGLIEVLLAVVLLSIGFLASARMQVQSMSYSQNAYALSQAKYLVLDMSERMRANREGLRAGFYDNLQTAASTTAPGCVAAATTCNASDRVAADLHAWSLPLHPVDAGTTPLLLSADGSSAIGSVVRDASTGIFEVSMTWADSVDGSSVERTVAVQVIPSTLP